MRHVGILAGGFGACAATKKEVHLDLSTNALGSQLQQP